MAQLLAVVHFIMSNGQNFVAAFVLSLVALVALLHAVIAVFMLLPGPEPEASLQKIADLVQKFVDFVSKFSRK